MVSEDLIARLEGALGDPGGQIVRDLRRFNEAVRLPDYEEAAYYARKALRGMLTSWGAAQDERCDDKTAEEILAALASGHLRSPSCVGICRNMLSIDPHELHDEITDLWGPALQRIATILLDTVSPKYGIVHGGAITDLQLQKTLDLDKEAYPSKFQFDLHRLRRWYERNPDNYTLIIEESSGKVVGYINAMPLVDEYFEKMRNGEIIDVDIPPEAILQYGFPHHFYKLYHAYPLDSTWLRSSPEGRQSAQQRRRWVAVGFRQPCRPRPSNPPEPAWSAWAPGWTALGLVESTG